MGAAKGTYDKVISLLGKISNKRILDCGAGKGAFTKELLKSKANVYACDINKEKFEVDTRFKKAELNKKIPFPDSFFDSIVAIEVIEHLENPAKLIREFKRTLKKDGCLVLTTPNIQNVKSKVQFFFKSNFHWFHESEFGDMGSQHINPLYWRELIYLLKKNNFRGIQILCNRKSGYTFYYTLKDNLLKRIFYFGLNLIMDVFYYILSFFMYPKDLNILLGDILVIKAIRS